jgi:endonuclease/exonuclease/phosphatase family metal-dependent hydrolase
MNNELPSEKPEQEQRSLDECFADKPHLRRRLLEISDMIETLVAQGCTAHEAEAKAIEQIRKLGNGILTEWAEKSEAAAAAKARAGDPKLRPYRKKKS